MRPWKNPVRAKTTAALAANTYANGSSGVGATLTGNANGALAAQDGVTLVANDRLLVDHEATGSHNGIYAVTQVGDGSHPYILTRTTDADEGGELVNATCKIAEGTLHADQEWQCKTNATITVGTTALVWQPASSLRDALVAGSNVTITDNGDGTYTVASSGGGGGGTLDGCKVRKSATLTGQNTTAGAFITWDSEDWDTNSYHSTSSNTERLTAPSAGYHFFNAALVLSSFTGTVSINVQQFDSSNTLIGIQSGQVAASTGSSTRVTCSGTVHMASGDYLKFSMTALTDTSVDITTDSWFEIRKVG
jgi:hypothetical protein